MVLADVEKFTLVVCFTLEEAGSPVRQYASHKSVGGWGEAYISVEVYLCSKYSGGRFIYHRKTNIWHMSGPPSS